MLLDAAQVQGLRGAAPWDVDDLGAVVDLPARPVGAVVADGLSLLHVALVPALARATLGRMGLLGGEVEVIEDGHGFLDQVSGFEPGAVSPWLAEPRERKVFTSVSARLDPMLFGRLREEAIRDPRVVTALGRDATLGVKVGWLFNRDCSAASVTILDVRVGDVSFPVNAQERPSWMTPILRDVGARIARPDPDEPLEALAGRLLAASISARPSERAAFRRLSRALASPPFGLGALELVQLGGRPTLAFGDSLAPLRWFGPSAARALRLAVAAIVDAPDVLIVDDGVDGALRAWLASCVEGEEATLEQVLLVGGAP